jgi:hypothetical protein
MGETVTVMGYWIPHENGCLLQGYPPPKNFIQGLEAVGLDVDFVNLYDIRQKYNENEIRLGLEMARSNKIILSYWDYIFHRDLESVFSDPTKKIIFCVNWNEEPRTEEQKHTILKNSEFVTLSQDFYRQKWINALGKSGKKYHDKMTVWRFPCTQGVELNKAECRKTVGQRLPNSVIAWGYYGKSKGHDDLLKWISGMYGTEALFCGTPCSHESQQYLLDYASTFGMSSRVHFSRPLISDEETDVWMSAADLGVVTYWHKIGESSLAYMLGHGKTVITSNLECFPEYAKHKAIVMTNRKEFKKTLCKYINDEKLRKEQENNARAYADKFNWITSGLQFKEMVESIK